MATPTCEGLVPTNFVPIAPWRVGVLSPGTFEVTRSKEMTCEVWSFEGPSTTTSQEPNLRYYARLLVWSTVNGAGYRVYEGAGPDVATTVRRAVRDMEDREGLVAWYTAPRGMPSPSAIYELVVGVGPSLQNLATAVASLKSSEG